ncbi:hypothetical protein GCM10027456_79150 [Kineosporia babensis]
MFPGTAQPFDRLLDVASEVVPKVPPVSHLYCVGDRIPRGLGICTGTIATDDVNVVAVLVQPGGERLGVSAGGEIERATRVEVDQDSAVVVPSAQREVVYSQDA